MRLAWNDSCAIGNAADHDWQYHGLDSCLAAVVNGFALLVWPVSLLYSRVLSKGYALYGIEWLWLFRQFYSAFTYCFSLGLTPQGFEKKGKIMAKITYTVELSNETIVFLMDEIEDILKHCDISEFVAEELSNLYSCMNKQGNVVLRLEDPPFDEAA